jgi:dipeptidyl-peptidase-4
MKKHLLLVASGLLLSFGASAQTTSADDPLPGYTQAERFAGNKLSTMLFSTSVDPHWFKAGNCFWYEYKTGNGNVWYVVDPSAKTKRPLFDQDKLAAELTEIVKDPYTAQQLPIQKLETGEDVLLLSKLPLHKTPKRTARIKTKRRKRRYSISPMIIRHVN